MVVVGVCLAEVGVVHLVVGQRGAVVRDPAVAHDDRPVDQRRHLAELVGDQHDGAAAVLELAQRVGERLLVGQVDAGRRLVEEEQVGRADQGPGDERPLLLPAGELGDPGLGLPGQADHADRVVDRCPVVAGERTQQPTAGERAGGDDLPHRRRDARAGAGTLGDEADPAPVVEVVERGAEQLEGSRR